MTKHAPASIEQDFMQVDGLRLRYLRAGPAEAPAVLFLHGLGDSAEIWMENMAALAREGYAVYALDGPGFGGSDRLGGIPRLDRLARLLADFVRTLGLDSTVIAGNSMGATWGLQFARDYPELVEALVVSDPFGVGLKLPVTRDRVLNVGLPSAMIALFGEVAWARERMLGVNFHEPSSAPRSFLSMGNGRALKENLTSRSLALIGLAMDLGFPRQRAAFLQALSDALTRNSVPTLIIWGREDRLLPAVHGEELHAALPESVLEVLPGCGHVPPVEKPGEFNRLTLEFLRSRGI